jgi:hypothetical protein
VIWFAAESDVGGGDMGVLAQYGVLGVFALLLILFAKISYKRETERADRLEAEVVRLNNLIIDRVIPALASATSVVEDATELLRSMQREREFSRAREARRLSEGD